MVNPHKGPQKAALTLLGTLVAYPPPAADPAVESLLDFHHGVSQIPNYDLKYPADFPHFDYVNPDAPKGRAIQKSFLGVKTCPNWRKSQLISSRRG